MGTIKKYVGCIFLLFTCTCFAGGVVEIKRDTSEKSKADLVKMRIGMLSLMSGGVVYMAKEEGYFREQGIDLEIVPFTSAQDVAWAIAADEIDVGLTGLTAAAYNLAGEEKNKLKIVGGGSREVQSCKGAAYVVSNEKWDAGVCRPEELKDISLGITNKGSTFHYLAGLLAEKYHFSLEEKINLIPLGSLPAMKTALGASKVDSVIIPGLVAQKLEDEKQGHIIGYVGNETPWQVTAVFASSQMLKEHHGQVEQFMTGFEKGCALYHQLFNISNPAEDSSKEQRAESSERLRVATIISEYVKPTLTPMVISSIPPYIDAECRIDLDSIKHQIEWYQARSMVTKGITVDQVIDSALVKPLTRSRAVLVQARQ